MRDNLAIMRQFGRLAFGEQVYGDEIARVIDALDRDGRIEDADRAGAIAQLLSAWKDGAGSEPEELFTDQAVLATVGSPPSDARTCLLLSDMMGFSQKEVVSVLAIPDDEFQELLKQGREEYASKAEGSLVIVEDDPLIASDLQEIAERIGVDVCGVEANAANAIDTILARKPDVVFLDFSLEGEDTGLDVFKALVGKHDCAVIFVTAFPEEVLSGVMPEPDLVFAKPYREETIRAALAHALAAPRSAIIDVA